MDAYTATEIAYKNGFEDGYNAAIEKMSPGANDPLTLDELRKMDGEPVWLQGTGGWIYTGWHIVKGRAGNCISICETPFCSKWISLDDYGELFLAYRHKPKVFNYE